MLTGDRRQELENLLRDVNEVHTLYRKLIDIKGDLDSSEAIKQDITLPLSNQITHLERVMSEKREAVSILMEDLYSRKDRGAFEYACSPNALSRDRGWYTNARGFNLPALEGASVLYRGNHTEYLIYRASKLDHRHHSVFQVMSRTAESLEAFDMRAVPGSNTVYTEEEVCDLLVSVWGHEGGVKSNVRST